MWPEVADRNVLVVGHADADGHLAAEQSRTNLIRAGAAFCATIVDPKVTRNYRFWERNLPCLEFGCAEIVIFVDIMLNPSGPERSLTALADRANDERDRTFFLIDHHEMGTLPTLPENLQVHFSPTVFGCCYGRPSELMLIASICDRDEEPVRHKLSKKHRQLALGVTRAAADTNRLAGANLLALLQDRQWNLFESLANDTPEDHRRVRGVRPASYPASDALKKAREVAAQLN